MGAWPTKGDSPRDVSPLIASESESEVKVEWKWSESEVKWSVFGPLIFIASESESEVKGKWKWEKVNPFLVL